MTARFLIYLLLASLAANPVFGKEDEENFATNKIPHSLLSNANAVIRKYHKEIRITSPNEVYVTERYAITILNEKGNKYAVLDEQYDKLSSIESIHGWLYDKDGNETGRIKKNEIKDVSDYNIETMFSDIRYKTFSFNCSSYPYTCLYEIEKKYTYSAFLPSFMPQKNYDVSVAQADVDVIYPQNFPLRHRTFHIYTSPTETVDGDDKKLSIEILNICAVAKPDYFTPEENYPAPTLILAADKFSLQDMEGSMATWQDFGKFFYQLNADRDKLPAETKKIVHNLTDTCHSSHQKINILYEYLKKNTRYVNISLGIGGWQTLDASFVAEKGYGDCKALSNFMMALLKEAGIPSYATLVYAGAEKEVSMQLDFPINAFDHVILCAVPTPSDTVWLECTAKDLPAGYLSDFTDNRFVLLITANGGYPVKTPANNTDDNFLIRNCTITINDKDELTGNIKSCYRGFWWEKECAHVIDQPRSKVNDYLNRKFAIPTYAVTDYKIGSVTDSGVPYLNENVCVSGTSTNAISGKRLFISPHILNFSIESPASYVPRKEPFQIAHSYRVVDSITINIAGNYTPEQLPKEVNIDYPFATYKSKVFFENGNVLKVVTRYDQKEGIYAPELFADYIALSKEINSNSAGERVVVTKKE